MKRFMKIVLLTLMAALCVASLAMSVAGATPDGRSGLNYFAVNAGEWGASIEVTIVVRRGSTEIHRSRQPATYDLQVGGVNTSYVANDINFQAGDVLEYTFHLGGMDVFKYCNVNTPVNMYYCNAVTRLTGDDMWTGACSYVNFYDSQGTLITSGGGRYPLESFNANTCVEYVTFGFDITREVSGVYRVDCTEVSLMQNNPIYTKYLLESDIENGIVSNLYVPYSGVWFADIYDSDAGYEDGYQDGYSQGAQDAGGAPIQRWGAFLITAVDGFMDFEIFPGFPLWGILAVAVAIPLLLTFLKMFAGG